MNIKKLSVLVLLITLLALPSIKIVYAQGQTTYIMSGSMSETASFVVYTQNSEVYAKNGLTGKVTEYSEIGACVNSLKGSVPSTGGIIFIKSGNYPQETTITLTEANEHLTISGEAYKTSTILTAQSNIYAFNITGTSQSSLVSHILIEHLKLVGYSSSSKSAFFLQYVGGCKFENLAIDEYGYGFYADTGATPNTLSQNLFRTITLYQCKLSGMVLQDTYDNRLEDIYVLDTEGSYLSSYAGILFIHAWGGDILDRCLVLGNEGHGIAITENSFWVLLSNCVSDNNEGNNIFLSECQGSQVSNCWGSTSNNSDTYGLNIDTCNDTLVSNGQFRTNGAHGIYIKDSNCTTITNTLSTTNGQISQGFGVAIVNSTRTLISNSIMNNRYAGSEFNATSQEAGIDEDSNSDYNIIVECDTRNMPLGIRVRGSHSKCNLCYNSTAWIP